MKKPTITIYHQYIPRVGGIETALYNLAKLLALKGYPTKIIFKDAEAESYILKYGDFADLEKLGEERVVSDIAIIMSNHEIPRQIQADKFYQIIHTDYERYGTWIKRLNNIDRIDQYIAVSKHSAKIAKKLYKVDCVVIPNLIDPDFGNEQENVLKLMTPTRISSEKGFARVLALCERFKKDKLKFEWRIYGDNTRDEGVEKEIKDSFLGMEEVKFLGYHKDITDGLRWCNYLALLSDWEGCPYAVLEALKMEKPCLITKYNGAEELIKDGKNGYIIPMDIERLTKGKMNKILYEIPVFKYKPISKIEQWEELIHSK